MVFVGKRLYNLKGLVFISSEKTLKDKLTTFSTKGCIMGVVPVAHLTKKSFEGVDGELINMWIRLNLLMCGEKDFNAMVIPEIVASEMALSQFP